MWMEIRSVAIFKYFLDYNVIMVIMHSNVDVNRTNGNFQVFLRPQCYYHYGSYAIECEWKSDQRQFSSILLDQNVSLEIATDLISIHIQLHDYKCDNNNLV